MGWKDFVRVIPGAGLLESMIDVQRHQVQPIRGSIVYCDLAFGLAEHSGVYIGSNKIVHLEKSGHISCDIPLGFLYGTPGINIRVSCNGLSPAGSEAVAKRAERQVGSRRRYHVLTNNCHQFTSGCLTGSFNNSRSLLSQLKVDAEENIQANDWRVWDISDADFFGFPPEYPTER